MAFQTSLDARAGAAAALLAWYDRHRRALPWRALPGEPADPYKVWLSEIMLQQTTVTAVKPYFLGFVARWPNVGLLAEASGEEVMRAWAGLGYYSRARNLHACAKIVAGPLNGKFPDTEAGLQGLPGTGPIHRGGHRGDRFRPPRSRHRRQCRAGACAPLFDRHAAARGKVRNQGQGCRHGAGRAARRFRAGDDGPWRHDLLAKTPFLRHLSPARILSRPCLGLPRKPAAQGATAGEAAAPGRRLFRAPPGRCGSRPHRPPKGLLGGMTEIPGTGWETHFDAASAARQAPVEASYRKLDKSVSHAFTHFALRLDIYVADVASRRRAPAGYRFVPDCGLDKEAFPSVMRKITKPCAEHSGCAPGFPPQVFAPFGFANRTKMFHVKHFGTIGEATYSKTSYIRRPSNE